MSLEVKNISKYFYNAKRGDFAAVDDISFSCAQGEILGLLGPNGAGKTTTLRMIGTLLAPDAGSITVQGVDAIAAPEEVRKRVGYLSADTGLYDKMTPRETLTFFAQLCKYPAEKIEARVAELLRWLKITEFADVFCEKLSTGTKQKVSIARTIVHDPPQLILDEPTSGLDVMAIQSMHQFVKECRSQGKGVILSTHVMSEAEKLCDRIAIIHRGKIFMIGTLEELREKTQQHYLEDIFISVVPENIDEF